MGHRSGGPPNLVGESSEGLLKKQHLDQDLHHGKMSDMTPVKGKSNYPKQKKLHFQLAYGKRSAFQALRSSASWLILLT